MNDTSTSYYVYCYFDQTGIPIYVGIASRDDKFQLPDSFPLKQAMEAAGGELPVSVIREALTHEAAELVLRGLIVAIGCRADGGPLYNDPDVYPDMAFHRKHGVKRSSRVVGNRVEVSFDSLYRQRMG